MELASQMAKAMRKINRIPTIDISANVNAWLIPCIALAEAIFNSLAPRPAKMSPGP